MIQTRPHLPTQQKATGYRPFIACALALALAALPGIWAGQAWAQQNPPREAGVITLRSEEVPVRITLTGRAVAQNATQLRPRVGGEITGILYTPGARVQAGDPLFALEPLTYRTALASAEAALARAKADLATAQTAYERADRLRQSSTGSQATFEAAENTLLKARATEVEAQADVELATAQLDWTTIRAPLSGIIGTAQVALGDLVTANQTQALAEIVQVDPLHVDLTEPYPTRLRIEADAASGAITLTPPQLALILDNGSRIEGTARLLSTSATVSATTGTRVLRFEVANPAGRIAPGMFLRGELTLGHQQAILVPQRATTRERDGTLTAWVSVDDVARKRSLDDVGTWGNAWIVKAGLAPGELLLVDGTTNLREGAALAPVAADIDGDGVVRDAAAAPATLPGN